jgi:hypothetical protein
MPRRMPRVVLASIMCGVVLTAGLTVTLFWVASGAAACIVLWQACLVQTVIHTTDNPIHEGSVIDVFAFGLGVVLGVPIYSALSYVVLRHWKTVSEKE